MNSVMLLVLTGAFLIASQPVVHSLPYSAVPDSSKVVLRPIYVGHGLSTVLSNGCSISIFDAGGSEPGFARLRKELLDRRTASQQAPKIDTLLISHIHKDHIGYLPQIAKDKVKIGTFISNLHAKQKASKLGILNLFGEPRMIFMGVSTVHYKSVQLPMNDPLKCTSKRVNIELLWGTLNVSDPGMTDLYMRHRENNDSVVSGIYGDITPVLFLGDMNIVGQKLLLKSAPSQLAKYKGGVVIAAHHGFSNGIYEELFRFLKPKTVIISRSHMRPMIKEDIEAIDRHVSGPSKREARLVECNSKIQKSIMDISPNSPKSCQTNVSQSIIQLSPNHRVEIVL